MPSISNPFIILFSAIVFLFSACNTNPTQSGDTAGNTNTASSNTNSPQDTVTNGSVLNEQQAQSIIELRATEVLALLSQNNMAGLVRFVHPEKGVRFSPYSYVQPETDLVFTPQQISQLAVDAKVYTWGSFDGSGDPMALTFKDYRKRFVTDKDYLTESDSIGYNKVIGTDNSLNNRTEVYPKAIIVEYYQSGKHPDYGGMDWGSVALVFEKYQAEWLLVAVIHNSWTI